MKLNLHILKEDLRQWNFQGILVDKPAELYCSYAVICYELPVFFQKDILYIINAGLLPERVIPETVPSILCLGLPPADWLQSRCNLLYTEERVSEIELINYVNTRFDYYQKWCDSLQEALDQHLSFQELGQRSGAVIQNPIYAQGAFFHVICMHFPTVEEETELYRSYRSNVNVAEGGTLNAEEINIMISDPEYNQAIQSTEPTIYSGVPYGFRTLFYNIFIENVFVSRICFDEIIHPFSEKDFALIHILGKYFKKALTNSQIYAFDRPVEIEETLQALLNHRLLPEQKIQSFLQIFGWNAADSYICLVLKLKAENTTVALEPLALQLSKFLTDECYTIKNDRIIFVCNLSRLSTNREQLYSAMLPFLRDNLLSAGISTTYYDFRNLYYYYQQAIIAGQIGEELNPTHWYFKFEEYQLEYMIRKCTEDTISEILIPEGLKTLMEYDREKNHDYTETLRIYLDHDRNIAETIRAAYMHRNTFLYRIQRIQEILKMDLDDPDVRLILQMAFRILDRQKDMNKS